MKTFVLGKEDFLDYVPKSWIHEEKFRYIWLHKNYKLVFDKRHYILKENFELEENTNNIVDKQCVFIQTTLRDNLDKITCSKMISIKYFIENLFDILFLPDVPFS